MLRISIPSNDMKSVGYDSTKKMLEIEFIPNGVIQYFNVPERVYAGLLNSKAYGTFFIRKIKYIYPYKRIPTT